MSLHESVRIDTQDSATKVEPYHFAGDSSRYIMEFQAILAGIHCIEDLGPSEDGFAECFKDRSFKVEMDQAVSFTKANHYYFDIFQACMIEMAKSKVDTQMG